MPKHIMFALKYNMFETQWLICYILHVCAPNIAVFVTQIYQCLWKFFFQHLFCRYLWCSAQQPLVFVCMLVDGVSVLSQNQKNKRETATNLCIAFWFTHSVVNRSSGRRHLRHLVITEEFFMSVCSETIYVYKLTV